MRYLAVLVLSLSLLTACYTAEEWAERQEQRELEIKHEAEVYVVEDILMMVHKDLMDWGHARAVLEAKGYTWMEAENLLKAYLPRERWIK